MESGHLALSIDIAVNAAVWNDAAPKVDESWILAQLSPVTKLDNIRLGELSIWPICLFMVFYIFRDMTTKPRPRPPKWKLWKYLRSPLLALTTLTKNRHSA